MNMFIDCVLRLMKLSECKCTILMCAVVTQALLEAPANMCNSATSQFGLKIIQRGSFSDNTFITFSFQVFQSRRRSSGIFVSQFNPLLHNS